ncbi:hypothetical protein BG011_006227 [Mortierella polycephala]|uniref:Ion transport domain-containing protein n=1 Tax=Mortierella polycephala TaxID=41804 RepID=A0A9P6U096_9FUNG|nr:hypothetical protein BG011_006227 [Mortierella polycephala]
MAIYSGGRITLHWILTGMIFGHSPRSNVNTIINSIRFNQDDTRILATTMNDNNDLTKAANGLIFETSTMAIVDKLFIPQTCNSQIPAMAGRDPTFYSIHEATLDHVPSYPQSGSTCTDQCLVSLTPLSSAQHSFTYNNPAQFTIASGLHYQLELLEPARSPNDVALSVTISNKSTSLKKLVISHTWPWLLIGSINYGVVLGCSMRLVLVSERCVFVWRLPDSLDGDLRLDFIKTSQFRYRWMGCAHQELYYSRKIFGKVEGNFHMECQFAVKDLKDFEKEMEVVVTTYLDAEAGTQMALLQYVGTHINGCYDSTRPSDPLLATICRLWTRESQKANRHHEHGQFLSALLECHDTRWFLRPDTPLESNPLWILLEAAKKESQIMLLSNILIDHCFERAGAEKDLGYLSTVLQCFHVLVSSGPLHTDLANRILRILTFFPVKTHKYIIDHHTIAHPSGSRWRFWKPIMQPLYYCQNPILQLSSECKSDPTIHRFTRDLCVAQFALLWQYRGDTIHSSDRQYMPRMVAPSWTRMLCVLIWHKCKLVADDNVKSHDFALDMLDSPAIAALIEYKWNTIGFKYCMVRFLFQCCYYLLVLIVVFLQIYGDYHGTLLGAFAAVAVISGLFLWLELVQLFKDWRHYISLIYNAIDLFLFGLPLAASINYFLIISGTIAGSTPEDGNAGFLSFSVGGRYDSINKELDSNNWAFLTLMSVFFFITTILMINALIASVNMALNDADKTWHLVWLEERLRVIERVENLTFHIPGFRQHYSWFPEEIYYSATADEIEDYQTKYLGGYRSTNTKAPHTSSSPEPASATNTGVEELLADTIPQQEMDKLLRRQEEFYKERNESAEKLAQEQITMFQGRLNVREESVKRHNALAQQQLREQVQEQLQKQMQEQMQEQKTASERQVAVLQEQNKGLQEQVKEIHAMLLILSKQASVESS